MFRLLKTPSTHRKILVFIGDLLMMLAIISMLVFIHVFAHRYGLMNIKRPLKPWALYVCIPVHIFLSYIFEVYDVRRKEKLRTLTSLLILSFLSFCLMFGLAKVLRINQTTMVYILVFFVLTAFAMFFWRLTCNRVLLSSRHFMKQKVIFIGSDATTDEILDEIKRRDYKILGTLVGDDTERRSSVKGLKVIGTLNDLLRIVRNRKPDLLVTGTEIRLPLDILKTLYKCKFSDCEVYDSAYFYELLTRKSALRLYLENESLPYFNIDSFARRHYKRIKTLMDILCASLALAILWPLLMVIGLLIKVTSRGPVFFTQERVGLHEKPFRLLKFRTMVVNAEPTGPRWSSKNDSRITTVGRFLRKSRLDELPQLINICRGEMSFIGPRPIREHMARLIEESMPFYSLRFTVKPGLTGWAQVNHDYGGTVEGHVEKFQYELYYLKHASSLLDILILLKTLQTVVRMQAY